ncbi:hypothetical protein QE429_004102 [Bacillus sp. SORGH_AS 510]|uniref:hypothetical protein n=1 Tax=Bacillus sp. SORGH_AS_0510 TaxID=3041771 RepID=UPI002789F0A6|nr:hypothetical protein [Bacillus sp. SORGH_AS_0510]MDQ1147275.1 hypothetical protein [Bacillus sp. SORGH_AS_0510]
MKKQSYLIIYTILFIIVLTSPFWLWKLQPAKKLNVLILDKTVPDQTYREHKGLVWILNNTKYFKNGTQPYSKVSDYKGFEPKSDQQYSVSSIPKDLNPYDVFYLTDQYGVYEKEFFGQNTTGQRSKKIYGGLTSKEIDHIEQALIHTKGKTLIAEFNTFASPTEELAKDKISNLLNVEWSGWIGRYFSNLGGTEVPEWVITHYKSQGKKWTFSGEGFVFINKDNFIVVISKEDMKDSGLTFKLTREGQKRFTSNLQGTYQYWFDVISPQNKAEVLANYSLPVTKEAKEELQSYGIPTTFPAVIYHQNARYSAYYFSGDYADEAEVPEIYQTKGFDTWIRTIGARDSFYWRTYVPMMKDILNQGLHKLDSQEKVDLVKQDGINLNSKTGKTYIQIQKDGKWNDFLIKGVNMGIGKPGYFPGETAISKQEYLRWFKEIGAMNANAIRVYTLHPPQFYEAFYEYNQMAKKPLYLMHGTWVNEENLIHTQDAYAQVNTDDARLEIKNMIDIIHGNANLAARPGHASGEYKYDISKYVLGMVLGTEWDPNMVANTNAKNAAVGQYNGKYFKTENSNPFEAWLAGLLDYATDYETNKYKWQHSLSFTNWVTTDLLEHPAEPLENEDMVSIDPNHIVATNQFHAGLFASYHIYPYYPDFLNYEPNYLHYVDLNGKKSNYAGYLHELRAAHNMPVLVAEFGVPSSRGLTHKNVYGMNQGFHSEKEQGEIDRQLYQSIVSEGYAGGLVFTWQDEWFKRTWNTMDFDNPDRRPYWNNQQTNEQHFGLLGFEPGKKETAITVDGVSSDWNLAGVERIYQSTDKEDLLKEVRMTSDSGYLYFQLKYNKPVDFKQEGTYLLLDTIDNQGQTNISLSKESKVRTDFGIDFLVKLTGPKDSRVMVDSYYDTFYFQYAKLLHLIKEEPYPEKKDNGIFHPIRLALNKKLTIPSSNTVVPFQDYETGVLRFGNANPTNKSFDSLTDISISSDNKTIEGRIPWQLLNFKDPSLREVMGDFWIHGLSESVESKGIRIAVVTTKLGIARQSFPKRSNNQINQKDSYLYSWKPWDSPVYYERLKDSYRIMSDTFLKTDIKDGVK